MTTATLRPAPAARDRRDGRIHHQDLCPHLPVLEGLHREIGGVAPSVGGFFGLQHLFGSTASLVDRICRGRIGPDRVFLLGKPYSTNLRVQAHLEQLRGYHVHPDSSRQSVTEENDATMDRRITSVLCALRDKLQGERALDGKRVLLIDDGGRAIRLLHSDRFADIRDRFTCVEQTRCGIRTIAGLELRIPVINVAESWVKLEHESPLIAESVNHELTRQLRVMEAAGIDTGRRILVIGYGSIGRAVSEEFAALGRVVEIFDTDTAKRAAAAADGHIVHDELHAALRGGGTIIGCTGLPTLGDDDYPHVPDGALLISASSADVEFQAWKLRAAGTCLGRPHDWPEVVAATGAPRDPADPRRDHPCFSLYRIANGQGRFFLVNGGFPVNFTGGVDPIVPEKIQLTRTLLYIGACQASRTAEPGLHDLDDGRQQRLMELYGAQGNARAA